MNREKKTALTAIVLAIDSCRQKLVESEEYEERLGVCKQMLILSNAFVSINNSSMLNKYDIDSLMDMLE